MERQLNQGDFMNLITRISIIAILILASRQLSAQSSVTAIDPKYIPSSAIGFATLNAKTVISLPEFKLYPTEVLSAAGMENVGIDPLKIERVDFITGMPGPAGPILAAMITMAEPINEAALNPQLFAGPGDRQR